MKAAVYEGEGKVTIQDLECKAPGAHQVKLKVKYVGICGSDVHIAQGHMDERLAAYGLPRIFGHEVSAVIVEIGDKVTDWKVGDRVVLYAMCGCTKCDLCKTDQENICLDVKSYGIDCDGAYAEYVTVEEHSLIKVPDSMSDEQAALVEPLSVTCHAVSRSGAKAGESAIVIGGGPIGLMTALVLKSKGVNVMISEISEIRLENCQKMKIATVNPMKEDVVAAAKKLSGNRGVDIVFEASGSKNGLETAPNLLAPGGRCILTATYSRPIEMKFNPYHFKQISLITTRAYERKDYAEAINLLSTGQVDGTALISKIVKLTDISAALESARAADAVKVLIDCNL